MAKFDADTLRELHDCREVAIRTEKHPDSAVVIWVVVANDEVFVRSVRGNKGRWYRDLAAGGAATLEFGGRGLAVQALPASDTDAITRASREYLRKYQPSPYAQSMVRTEVLPTTFAAGTALRMFSRRYRMRKARTWPRGNRRNRR